MTLIGFNEASNDQKLPANTWVIMGGGYWGAGETLDAARSQFKAAGGRFKVSRYFSAPRALLFVHEAHTEVVVDSMGGLVTRSKVPGQAVNVPAYVEQTVTLNGLGKPTTKVHGVCGGTSKTCGLWGCSKHNGL